MEYSKLSLLAVFSAAFLLSTCQAQAPGIDLTLQLEAVGTEVVLASISLIEQSEIFPNDNRLLRRIAFVESGDGIDIDTFRAGYNGGIWQVDENIFNQTQDVTANPELTQTYQQLQTTFLINWETATWADLRRPLFSALAARLYFTIVNEQIPLAADLRGQGDYWKNNYNSNSEDTVQEFVDTVTELEEEECPVRGLDLAFVLDSSGSVGFNNFQITKAFAENVTNTFAVGPQDTQVGAIAFSGFANISFRLNSSSNRSEVVQAIRDIVFFDIPGNGRASTNTAGALRTLRLDVLTTEAGARPMNLAVPRVAIVLTDGRSNVNRSQTIPEAEAVRDSGIIVFAVGIGRRINMQELNAIASSPNFVSLLTDFNVLEFQSLQRILSVEACRVPAPVDIEQPVSITLDGGELSFFQFQLPVEGMTLQLQVQEGRTVLYASSRIRNPSSAFYDVRLETDSTADAYLDPSDFENISPQPTFMKRQITSMFTNTTIFVSIEGLDDINSITLETTFGDTSSALGTCATVGLLISLVLLAASHIL